MNGIRNSVNAGNRSTLRFSKMHGAGNDFVVLDLRDAREPPPELCRLLSHRHTGIGCDMILGIRRPRRSEAVVSFGIWTPDGATSQQCGNGARCVAAWVVRAGLTSHESRHSPPSMKALGRCTI
jgi:diaminopimelate epimerase/O-ureido-serine racemase